MIPNNMRRNFSPKQNASKSSVYPSCEPERFFSGKGA